ncbi:MAG: hypothetical protein MRY63_02805 [Neomegalonema sp.]|nr:hypothetical protein [Neomegalonema sp.]
MSERRLFLRRVIAGGGAAALLGATSGCDTLSSRGPNVIEQVAFTGPPVSLKIARLALALDRPSGAGQRLEYLFPTPMSEWVKRWAYDRLVAAGTQGEATLTLEKAGLRMESVPGSGLLGLGAQEKYFTQIKLRLDFGRGTQRGQAEYEARSEGVLHGEVTDADRRAYLSRMSKAMMADVDAHFPGILRRDLPDFVA